MDEPVLDGRRVIQIDVGEAIDMCAEWDGHLGQLDEFAAIIQSAYNTGNGAAVHCMCSCLLEHDNLPALHRAKFHAFLSATDLAHTAHHILHATQAIAEAATLQTTGSDPDVERWQRIIAQRHANIAASSVAADLEPPPLTIPSLDGVSEVNPGEASAAPDSGEPAEKADKAPKAKEVEEAEPMGGFSKEKRDEHERKAGATLRKLRLPKGRRMKAANDSYRLGEGSKGTLGKLTIRTKKSSERPGIFEEWKDTTGQEEQEGQNKGSASGSEVE